MAEPARVSVITKLWWGLGSSAEKIALGAIGSFAFFFYNQVLGIPATLAGLAMTVSLVIDGFADPIMGSLSDRTHSKLGRRHPYMFAAPIPMALATVAIFNPPSTLQIAWLTVWFATFVSALRVSMSLFHTPHLALGGELSPDYRERSDVMSYNTFFGFSAGALMNWIAYTYFFNATPAYPRGLMNPHAYPSFSIMCAVAILLALFGSAWFTRDRIPFLPKPPKDLPRFSPLEFLKDVRKALANANYVSLLIAIFFVSCNLGLIEGLRLYVLTFFWGIGSEQIRLFVLGDVIAFVVSFFGVARANAAFGKRNTIVVCGFIMMLLPILAPALRILGVFPPNSSPLFMPLLIGLQTITNAALTMLGITVMSALADIADENELRFGIRQEGILYSTRALFSKIDSAIGTLIAGVSLDLLKFPAHANPAEVPVSTSTSLALLATAGAAVPGLIGLYFYSRYKITHAAYLNTRAQLEAARAERASAAARSTAA